MKRSLYSVALSSSLMCLASAQANPQIQGAGVPSAPVAHDDSNKTGVPAAPVLVPSTLPVELGAESSPTQERVKSGDAAIENALQGETRLERLLTAPLVAFEGDEAIVRARGYKMIASSEGFLYSPVVGNQPDSSVRLSLNSVTRGGEALPLAGNVSLRDVSGQIEVDRGSVVEAYDYEMESVEQKFRFDQLEGSGDLVVTMGVETSLAMSEGPNGLRFSGDAAQIDYSAAFVYDATGKKMPIETRWNADSITLTVPSSYLSDATLPVTIDPVIDSFAFGGGTLDDSEPDLAFDRDENRYLVVFQDYVTATDTDLYYFAVEQNGTIEAASFGVLAIGSTAHAKPAVAVNDAADQFLVVAEALPSAATNRQIEGFLVDVTPASSSGYTSGTSFVINDGPGGFDCFNADAAGNTFGSVNAFSYLVTWTRTFSATDNDVHGRIVTSTGALTTGRINIDNSSADDIQCSVSSSIGDSSVGGNYYNVVWVRDDNDNEQGAVWARRVYFDGTFAGPSPSAAFAVTAFTNCVNPVTTSASLVNLEVTGERYFVVAYPRVFGGPQASIYSSVMTFGDVSGPSQSITAMEDLDIEEDQTDVAIASDGEGFMLAYAERFSANDYDQYLVSGGVQDRPFNGFVTTLSERHVNAAFSGATERGAAIASQYDGNERGTGSEDDACVVWTEGGDPSTSRIEGVTFDLLNNVPFFGDRPIGSQYCSAELNASGRRGWISAMSGDQSVGNNKRLVAIDLTTNAFGYLIAGRNSTFVPNPGGAAGNLCVAGGGRYVNAIANSGVNGTITTSVNPSSVPQPNGFVSIVPGETWYFQLWSRDVQAGSATSNFTNGVAITFTP